MLIYFALAIPLIAIIILAVFFTRKIAWWEYLLLFGIPLIIIIIVKQSSIYSQTQDKEYWNNYLIQATYYEYWNEWIEKTCYHTCYDQCTDTKGNSYSCNPHDCNPYDCSYEQKHFATWEAIDNQGKHYTITQAKFQELCQLWGNKTFKDMHRDYYTVDGDAYVTKYDTAIERIAPVTSLHSYENKIKCSRSVFNFAEVDTEDIKSFGLYNYPEVPYDGFNYNPILGWSNQSASIRLQQYNARLGASKQIHMLILVFVNKPVQAALLQESYWKGGNKNEFILCIGLKNSQEISWAKVISWTEVDELKIRVQQTVQGMPFDLVKISDYMAGEVQKKFVRKQFKDFSYITVEPTNTAVAWAFIITFIVTIGLSIFSIKNEIDMGD